GQERALGVPASPPAGRRQHVELARVGRRALEVRASQHHICAVLLRCGDRGEPAPERGQRALRAQGATGLPAGSRARAACSRSRPAWTSWSESTSGAPRRAAEIALAAAIPPAIVVMQGIPWAIEEVLIS